MTDVPRTGTPGPLLAGPRVESARANGEVRSARGAYASRLRRGKGGTVVEVVLVAVASLTAGFATGLFLFKIKSRWCPRCGSLTLPSSAHAEVKVGRHA